MASSLKHTIIPGSDRFPLAGARATGPVPAGQHIEVTVRLRANPQRAALDARLEAMPPGTRRHLSREEFALQYGALSDDVDRIEAFARQYGLSVVVARPAQRQVVLAGTAAAFGKAFGTTLEQYQYADGTYRSHIGHLMAPGDLAGVIEGVFGLDNRPQASMRLRMHAKEQAINGYFFPPEVARLYDFPPDLDGSGQCIAIIELGGGFRPADIDAYFTELGITPPVVKAVSIDGADNAPTGNANSADAEVMLDIEVSGSIAHNALIAVYFAPNSERGFLDAITAAVYDTDNKPSVMSISWGAPESEWSGQALTAFEQTFADAAALGVTICCASGDRGSSDGEAGPTVDFPSSAPHALGCGGTRLTVDSDNTVSEIVWNDGPDSATGGGFSAFFPVPGYQDGLAVAGRGVPDVAGNADPLSGYIIRIDGAYYVVGGTSAASPLWAGLIALINQRLATPVGFLNPRLYGPLKNRGVTRDIVTGNNGAYQAGPGWDPCTGWGSPRGQALLLALTEATPGCIPDSMAK